MHDDDYEQLIGFINNFYNILVRQEVHRFFPDQHQQSFARALEDLDRYFDQVDRGLRIHRRPKKLYQAGLWGNQLEFKLGVFNDAYQNISQMRTRETIARGLDAGIIIMESIGKAFPMAEAITETAKVGKHILENGRV